MEAPVGDVARNWLRGTLLYRLWSRYRSWRFRTVVLSGMKFAEIDGVRLELGGLSPRMREALVLGRYEVAELQLCRNLLSSDDRVVEIGSAIGLLGIFAVKRLGIREYFCIEANPVTGDMLKANHLLNGVEPRLWIAALAPENGPVTLYVTEDFWTDSVLPDPTHAKRRGVTVQGFRLATLLEKVPFSPTTLIVDVEGAETCLIDETIPRGIDKVIIELHPRIVGAANASAVLEHLVNQGFQVQSTFDDSYALVRMQVEALH